MNSLVSILIGVFIILGVGGFVFFQKSGNDLAQQPTSVESGTNPGVNDVQVSVSSDASPSIDDEEEIEDEDDDRPVQIPATTNSGAGASPASSGITAATVASHNSRTSCWSSINGSVYDLTSWIPKHPGGEQAILGLCGVDGSSKFNRKHGGDASKEKILFGFKIGALAQ